MPQAQPAPARQHQWVIVVVVRLAVAAAEEDKRAVQDRAVFFLRVRQPVQEISQLTCLKAVPLAQLHRSVRLIPRVRE